MSMIGLGVIADAELSEPVLRTLDGNFPELRKGEVRRVILLGTSVNRGDLGDSGPLSPAPTYTLPQKERHQEGNDDERNPDCTPPRPRARRHSLTL